VSPVIALLPPSSAPCSSIRFARAGLTRLVFVGEGVAGYLADGGRTLRDHAAKTHALGREEIALRIPMT